ncbi:DUF2799 domain-containing protein [Eoetvoesiella caeni]
MRIANQSLTLFRWLALSGFLGLLAGCASMSPEECRTANWREQGMRDGQNGQPRSYLEEHREACGKVGVTPDARSYEAGRAIGIKQYCTPANGLEEGRYGHTYRNSCPPELERAFLDRYRAGYRVYEAQRRVENLTSEQRSKQYNLDRAKDDKARDSLRRQLRDLDYSLRRARDDLYYEEQRLRP